MTAPAFRAAGTLATASGNGIKLTSIGAVDSGNGAVTPGLPAVHTTNDILLLLVQSSAETISAPSGGWLEVANSPQTTGTAATAGSVKLAVFWLRDNGSVAAPTVADTGNHTIAQILCFRGCVTSGDPWDVTAGNTLSSAATGITYPGLTTTVNNTTVVLIGGHDIDATSATLSGTLSSNLDLLNSNVSFNGGGSAVATSTGTGGGFGYDIGVMQAAGSIGALTGRSWNSSTKQANISIALKPAGTTTFTAALPTGHTADDILLLFVAAATGGGNAVVAPTGYAEVTNSPQIGNNAGVGNSPQIKLNVYWKRDGGSEVAPTLNAGIGEVAAQILAFSGCTTSGNPWDVTAGDGLGSASTSVTIPAVTTTVTDTLIVDVVASSAGSGTTAITAGSWTNANLTSLTEQTDQYTRGNTQTLFGDLGEGFAVNTGVKATAGSTGTTTATLSNTCVQARLKIALKVGIITNVGSSAGSSTAQATSSATKRSPGSVTGAGTALATSKATKTAVGAVTGTSTVSATGRARLRSPGSAAGTSTLIGVGAAKFRGIAASAGLATPLAVSNATKRAPASAAGVASSAVVGKSQFRGVAAAAGIAAVSGVVSTPSAPDASYYYRLLGVG